MTMKFLFTILLGLTLLSKCLSQSSFDVQNTICYCKSAGFSVSNVLKVDSNHLIAKNLWNSPKTPEALGSSGISYSQSQLLLLQAFKMIRKEGDKFIGNIPFLDSTSTAFLRQDSKARAVAVFPYIEQDINQLVNYLNKSGYAKQAFSLLFSYVLDGKIWSEFEKRKAIAPRQLTTEKPLWAGEFWSLHSQRKLKCGTNTYDGKNGVELSINWAYPAIPKLSYFFRQWGSSKLLDNLNTSFFITDEKIRKELESMHIVDASGKISVPVVEESKTNFIYQQTMKIVDKLAEQLLKTTFNALQQKIQFNSLSQTIIISYHEIMWDLLGLLIGKGTVKIPSLFTDGTDYKPEDISEVIFLTHKSKG
jgi:hypothetical protein